MSTPTPTSPGLEIGRGIAGIIMWSLVLFMVIGAIIAIVGGHLFDDDPGQLDGCSKSLSVQVSGDRVFGSSDGFATQCDPSR